MVKAILRERLYFSSAEHLYRELEQLDPAFRAAAKVIEYDYEEEHTFSGELTRYSTLLLEAELDASPEA